MLLGTNKETEENRMIVTKDVLPTIKQMVQWIYTNTTDSSLGLQDYIDLYKIAHQYELIRLSERCKTFILSKMSVENAFEIYMLGKVHEDAAMMDKSYQTIVV